MSVHFLESILKHGTIYLQQEISVDFDLIIGSNPQADFVVVASAMKCIGEAELYVGITRAISQLTIIGPSELGNRLGMTSK